MSAARIAAVGGLLIGALLIETAVLARLPLPGPTPDLMLLVVIGVALTTGANAGAVTGFAAGLLLSLAPPSLAPVGFASILYALVGHYIGSRAAGERLARGELAGLAACAGGLVSAVTLTVSPVWGMAWPGPVEAGVLIAVQAGYCALLALVVTPAVSSAVAAVPGRG